MAAFAFESLIAPQQVEGDGSRIAVTFEAAQCFGVGEDAVVMGGCVLATVIQASHQLVRALHPQCVHVCNVSSTFIAPVEIGEYTVVLQVLQAGFRTVQTVSKLVREDRTVHLMAGVFGEIPSGAASGEEWQSVHRCSLPEPASCTVVGPTGWMHGGVSENGSYAGTHAA
jgi:hypothetical protein